MLRDARMSAITREPKTFNNYLGFEQGLVPVIAELHDAKLTLASNHRRLIVKREFRQDY